MLNKKVKSQLENIFKKLGNDLSVWVDTLVQLFEKVSNNQKLTASLSWEFVNKQVKRKIEK